MKLVELQQAYVERINDLSRTTLDLFPDANNVLASYVDFCNQNGLASAAKQKLEEMLEKYGDSSPSVYVTAITSFLALDDLEAAKSCLSRGVVLHKDSSLFKVAFRLILDEVKKNRSQCVGTDMKTDPTMTTSVAETIYGHMITVTKDIELMYSVLTLCWKYDFTIGWQRRILNDICQFFSHDERMYDIQAQNEIHFMRKQSKKKTLTRQQLLHVNCMYKHTLERVNTERMWGFYIDQLHRLIQHDNHMTMLKHNLLFQALTDAQQQATLPEKYYTLWVQKLEERNKPKKAAQVMELIEKKQLLTVKVYESYLKAVLKQGTLRRILSVFRKGVRKLGKESLPLWLLLLNSQVLKKNRKVAKMYQEGWSQPVEVSQVLRPMFLEHLERSAGLAEARLQYMYGAGEEPYSLPVHRAMLRIETRQDTPSAEYMRTVHTLACKQFGRESTDVWVEALKFEVKNDVSRVREIYENAIQTLYKFHVDGFLLELQILGLSTLVSEQPVQLEHIKKEETEQ